MNTYQDQNELPLKGSLSLIYIFSFVIAMLMLIASAVGLQYNTIVYPTEELVQTFLSNDVVNLLIGLPILLGSMWLAWRGKMMGLLCWPGTLFFVTYNYIAYVFAMPLNWLFILHLALVALSVYTLAGLVAKIDGRLLKQRLVGKVPEKVAGGILAGLGILFLLRGLGVMIDAISNGTALPETELAVTIADFLTTPAWVIGGILLWTRREFGYVCGMGLLFQGSMLFVALIIFLLLQPLLTNASFAMADVVVIAVMGLVCFIPFGMFVRGVVKDHS